MRRLAWALAVLLGVSIGGLPAGVALAAPAYPKPLPAQWWFDAWQVRELLWPRTQGEGVIVAVLDTGVQANLPDLRGVVLPGADVTGHGTDGRVDVDTEPDAVAGHGTAMASLIASQGAATGFVGVAPKARILPVTTHGGGAIGAFSKGIRWAVDHGAQVINISQAANSECVPEVQEAVGYAIEHDVIVVAGAGNVGDEENYASMPADCAGVVAVGAVGVAGDKFAPWSKTERQPYVAVGAAGVNTPGLLRDGVVHTGAGGTSSASALTSGVLALARSAYPDMPAREVVRRLIGSCLDVAPDGRDDQTGYGMIRPNRVLTGNVPDGGPNPVFAAYDSWKAEQAASASAAPAPVAEPARKSEERIILIVVVGVVALAGLLVLAVFAVVLRLRLRS
ncbi:subtilase family protein [Asanoa ferruginea]|uniref:Subtilase family protein n=1 Tax=Asanoa ferruginea TaxID=53367 RepID=A0A3D9ZIA8_9ACTN|nr:S8 family serine peptidase [Asanoa ferruginea]REF97166.1 subtilase family protein [Asanoa ferruginea]GIF50116.1 type VII secretion-associated serine protease [Asanoa ferruginea]